MTALKTLAPRRRWFAGVCTAKLALPTNLRKSDPRLMRPSALLRMLRREMRELERALRTEAPPYSIRECADVSNIAALLADNLRHRWNNGKGRR